MNNSFGDKNVKESFLKDFKELLNKYSAKEYPAEISCEDHYMGYAECGEDVRMTVIIPGIYDENGNIAREHTEIDLGRYFDSK